MSVCGLFIAPRKLKQVKHNIDNFFNIMENAYLYFYCGNGLSTHYSSLVDIYPRLIIRELDVSNLDGNTYSDFMKSRSLWESISGDYVLTIQTDGCLCKKSPYTISDFTMYDYVGGYAPQESGWKETRGLHEYSSFQYFNGGFSLRKRQSMIDAIDTYPPQKSVPFKPDNSFETYWEDLYYTVCLLKMKKKVGLDEYATHFCSHTMYSLPTFCIHKTAAYVNKSILLKCLEYCPEYVFFLKPEYE